MSTAIAINGRFLTQALTGVQRYAIETVRALDALLAGATGNSRPAVELVVPSGHGWPHGRLSAIRIRQIGRLQGHLWEQLELPLHVRGRVLLNLCNTYPILAVRPIVTVHDASVYAAPDGYTPAFARFYRLLFGCLRLRSGVPVLTDSSFSSDELQRHLGLPPNRLHVVPCGADHWRRVIPDDRILAKLSIRMHGYVLGVASENPNKNLARLIAAFGRVREAPQKLVLVGGRNARVFARSEERDPEWLVRAGTISDAELAALYQSASCLAFPSLYEGFGLPPLEAMTFGCPVLSSRSASLPAVCGDAAQYCNGDDEADIAAGLATLLGDSRLRERLVEAGQRRVSQFRWQNTAQQVLNLVETVAS